MDVTGAATLSSTLMDGDTDLDDTDVDGTLDVSGAIGVDGNRAAMDKFTVDATGHDSWNDGRYRCCDVEQHGCGR